MKRRKVENPTDTVYQETSADGAFRFEVYRDRGLFKVRTERKITDEYMGPDWFGWIPVSDMAHIADSLERAVEIGQEGLRCLASEAALEDNQQ